MKLSGPVDVEFINETFFPDYKDVSVINEGECFLWAYIVWCLYEGIELWDCGIHAFVRYNGKFYDSEKPQGEDDWKDLPACNFGCGLGFREAERYHVVNFKRDWEISAERFEIDWYEIRERVQRVIDEK